jgi:hypothetical protein
MQEYMTVCEAAEKPLVLLHMLQALAFTRVLCFVGSVDATHRYGHWPFAKTSAVARAHFL